MSRRIRRGFWWWAPLGALFGAVGTFVVAPLVQPTLAMAGVSIRDWFFEPEPELWLRVIRQTQEHVEFYVRNTGTSPAVVESLEFCPPAHIEQRRLLPADKAKSSFVDSDWDREAKRYDQDAAVAIANRFVDEGSEELFANCTAHDSGVLPIVDRQRLVGPGEAISFRSSRPRDFELATVAERPYAGTVYFCMLTLRARANEKRLLRLHLLTGCNRYPYDGSYRPRHWSTQ